MYPAINSTLYSVLLTYSRETITSVRYNAESLLLICRQQCSTVAMDTVSDAEWSRQARANLTLNVGMRAAEPAPDVVLSSPDVRLLKLASPELERLVLQQYSQHHHHHQQQQHQQQESSMDRGLTLDVVANEEYTRGFVDALFEVHAQRQADCNPAVCRSTTSTSTTPAATSYVVHGTPYQAAFCHAVAAGRDDVAFSDTPPLSPLDSPRQVDDECSRLERKRARNRQAAMRCRNRKLERIDQLQSQADQLRAANAKLSDEVNHLRAMVSKLRQEVLLHADCQLAVSLPPRTTVFDNNIR